MTYFISLRILIAVFLILICDLSIFTDFNSISLQVFAFVKSNQSNNSPHRANCHVCDCLLEFRTKVEVT